MWVLAEVTIQNRYPMLVCTSFHLGEPLFLRFSPRSLLFTLPLHSPTFPWQTPSQLPPPTPLGTQLSEWLRVVLLATTAQPSELSALSSAHSFCILPLRLVPLTQAVAQLSAKLIWPNVTLL